MIQFFAPDLLSSATLPPDESAHCIRVLRHREGDIIQVIDGSGVLYQCRIVDADPRHTMVEIVDSADAPKFWKPTITIGVAPTKNMDRMEWMTEKCVELGVDKIVPLLCAHSERKVLKEERLRKIAISAMKQSLKTVLPQIEPLTDFAEFIALHRDKSDEMKFIGYCDKSYPLRNLIAEYKAPEDVVIIIGPEGDFSPDEVSMAVNAGFIPVTFGKSRLRTETAALSALQIVHILNQEYEIS